MCCVFLVPALGLLAQDNEKSLFGDEDRIRSTIVEVDGYAYLSEDKTLKALGGKPWPSKREAPPCTKWHPQDRNSSRLIGFPRMTE